MAASPAGLVGPVPFKDVAGAADDNHICPLPDEYRVIISTLPSVTVLGRFLMHNYQGVWMVHQRVAGAISLQRRFAPRPRGDVLLASPSKCGTTWLKALSFATMARATYPATSGDHPLLRLNPHECVPFIDDLFSAGHEAKLEALPSPRLMSTHMQYSFLPASVAHDPDCKVIYVCREPKDMLVSMWHFVRSITPDCSFSDLFESACQGQIPDGPIWDHLLGYWRANRASPGRVLFLRYEEMLLNPVGTVRELARFLGVPFSAAEEEEEAPADIVSLCSIQTLKGVGANKTGTSGVFFKFPHQSYFRKGVAGDWVNHMTLEMARRFDAIVEDKLHGSGLAFS